VSAEPAEVLRAIDELAVGLDQLSKDIDSGTDEYMEAEEAWLEVYDEAYEELDAERSPDSRSKPSQHACEVRARSKNRAAYHRYRRAKKNLDQLTARQSGMGKALSARQSELNALRDELAAGGAASRGQASVVRGAADLAFSKEFLGR
jgi:hypothetical protein